MKYDPKFNKMWNKDLAYIFGLLLGDGSLPKSFTKRSKKYKNPIQKRHIIHFFSGSRKFIEIIYIPLFKKIFKLRPRIEIKKRKGYKNRYVATIESKKIYEFLHGKGFTIGKKAKIAKIPNLPKKYYSYLLAGLLDTDGGKKGSGFGLSTASKYLANFCIYCFNKFNLNYNSTPWYYNDHIYHQVYLPRKYMKDLLKFVPIKNKDKINFIKLNSPR